MIRIKHKSNVIFTLIIFFIVIVVLVSCSSPPPTVSIKRICPTTTPNALMNSVSDPSKLIVVLIKEHPDYREYAEQAFDILSRVLPEVLEPGDRVIMMTMEHNNLRESIFFDGEIQPLPKPVLVNSPTPPPTIGPLPSPTVLPKGGYMAAVATQDAIRYMQSTRVAATEIAFEYGCAQEEWKQNGEQAWQEWNAKRLASISEFMNKWNNSINANKSEGFQIEKRQVFESLKLASQLLESECASYDECHLVVFSDFRDYRIGNPPTITLTFQGVDIVGVLLNCHYQTECQKNIDWWKEYFDSLGCTQLQFVVGDKAEQILLNHFRR